MTRHLVLFLSLSACPKPMSFGGGEPNSPVCTDAIGQHVERVDRYEWNGDEYFLVDYGCCDQYQDVFEADSCTYVCAPSGGMSGFGDGSCPTFSDDAVFVETVFEAPPS